MLITTQDSVWISWWDDGWGFVQVALLIMNFSVDSINNMAPHGLHLGRFFRQDSGTSDAHTAQILEIDKRILSDPYLFLLCSPGTVMLLLSIYYVPWTLQVHSRYTHSHIQLGDLSISDFVKSF